MGLDLLMWGWVRTSMTAEKSNGAPVHLILHQAPGRTSTVRGVPRFFFVLRPAVLCHFFLLGSACTS